MRVSTLARNEQTAYSRRAHLLGIRLLLWGAAGALVDAPDQRAGPAGGAGLPPRRRRDRYTGRAITKVMSPSQPTGTFGSATCSTDEAMRAKPGCDAPARLAM